MFRRQMMRLIGATPEPDLVPPGQNKKLERRVEGILALPGPDGSVLVLVMFAAGRKGLGSLEDVRSKDAMPSARSLRLARNAGMVLLIVADEAPRDELVVLARKYGSVKLGTESDIHTRSVIWVVGVRELVARADVFVDLVDQRDAGGWGARFRRWWTGSVVEVPINPLLLEM